MPLSLLKQSSFIKPSGLVEKHLDRIFIFMLWLINKKEMHGYEIIKLLRQNKFPIATPGRIYPLLMMMAMRGFIAQKEKRHGKRLRKVYHLTKKGREFLAMGKNLYFPKLVADFLREMIR